MFPVDISTLVMIMRNNMYFPRGLLKGHYTVYNNIGGQLGELLTPTTSLAYFDRRNKNIVADIFYAGKKYYIVPLDRHGTKVSD